MNEQCLSDQEILSLFIQSAEKLQELVQGFSAEDLDLVSEADGWTIREIIHHLADDCDVWSMCIKKAIATSGALVRFEGFPGNEAWAEGLDFKTRQIEPAVGLIIAHREYLTNMLEHFSDAWDRTVRLANAEGDVVREFTVREMAKMLVDHMMEHVETIERTSVPSNSK
jgi:hypothetical protein